MQKDMINKIAVTFTVDKAESDKLPHGTIEAIIATEDLDRHNEHMKVSGIDTPRKNYKCYYNHSYHGSKDLPIGVIEQLTKKGGQLIGRIKLAVNEYPFAEQVYKLVQFGAIDSMSIGFVPKEWDENSQTWIRSEFVEASLVAEPANVAAMVTSKGLSQAEADKFIRLEKAFTDEVTSKSADRVKAITADLDSLSLTEIKTVLQNAKQSIGQLEALANYAEHTTNRTAHKKTLIKLRIAGKGLDKSAEQINRAIKIKLRVKNPKE